MRGVVLVVLAACGHAAPAPVATPPAQTVPRLKAPPAADPSARGAAYLSQVALQLQPGWGQFLDDCRLRLTVDHPLNQMGLAATAEIAIEGDGKVARVDVKSSGNADFDRAVRDAIADAAPLPAPPPDLVSDDNAVHLRWLFARDRRQAGPATAEVVEYEADLHAVAHAWIASHELARLARRLARVTAHDRETIMPELATAIVGEALAAEDGEARALAVTAVRRAKLVELVDRVRPLIHRINGHQVELVAVATLGELGDRGAADALAAELRTQLSERHRANARALAGALATLGERTRLAAALRSALDDRGRHEDERVLAISLLAFAPELAADLADRLDAGDARTRAAACSAMTAVEPAVGAPRIMRGLRDGDASVRAACVDAARAQLEHHGDDRRLTALHARVRELARDRDVEVRRRAVAAVTALDPAHAIRALDDTVEVRASYAAALADHLDLPALAADANDLLDDRSPEVRAAAWRTLAAAPDHLADAAAPARGAVDPSPDVRKLAVGVLANDDLLARLAASDDSPAVRTEALVRLTARRGRAASEVALLGQIAAAAPGSPERVRAALAWLLAK